MSPSKIILDLNKYPEITDVNDFLKWIKNSISNKPFEHEYYKDKYYLEIIIYHDREKNHLDFKFALNDINDIESELSESAKRELRELLRGT